MMLNDKLIKIEINAQNRKKYQERLGKELNKRQIITIEQSQLLATSRIEVECVCDFCKESFMKERVKVRNLTFCNNGCKNNYNKIAFKGSANPNPKKDEIKVNCYICDKPFGVFESKYKKQNIFLCSRNCYKKHRSENYRGEKVYNYQDEHVECPMCKKPVKTSKWYMDTKKHKFCSQECYWGHRKVYYKEFYYKDDLNNSRKETIPEKMVREWLESKGFIKDKDFYQECGFLKKYYVDFYIPKYKMIIEVYGDYWHVNPEIYDVFENDKNKKPLNDNQREHIYSKYDETRNKELESYGYKVFVLWEKDIHDNLDFHISKIFNNQIVNKQESVTTTRHAPIVST